MKFNKKVNPVTALQFKYGTDDNEKMRKFLPFAEVDFDKSRHPTAVANIQIYTFKGFSHVKNLPMRGVEGDWVVKNSRGEIEILTDDNFKENYEQVIE